MEMSTAEAVKTIDELMPVDVVLWASFAFYAENNSAYDLLARGIVGQEPELTRINDEAGKARIKIYAAPKGRRIVVATPYLVEADGLLEKAGLVVLDPMFVSCEGYEGMSENEIIPERLRSNPRYCAPIHFAEKANQTAQVAVYSSVEKGSTIKDPEASSETPEYWLTRFCREVLGREDFIPDSSIYKREKEKCLLVLNPEAVEGVASALVKLLEKGRPT